MEISTLCKVMYIYSYGTTNKMQLFRLSPCLECSLCSFGNFSGVWISALAYLLFYILPSFFFTFYSWSPRTMEPTLSSETSAFIIQTPGKFPKEHRLQDAAVFKIIYSCKTLFVFRTVIPPIIRSSKLHMRQQAYVKQLLLRAASGDEIASSMRHTVAQLVETLRYKPEGRGFDSRWFHWNFSLTQSFWPHYGWLSL